MKRAKTRVLTFLLIFLTGSVFLSIHTQAKQDVGELQQAEEISKQNEVLDAKIAEYNKLLNDFSPLAKNNVTITPAMTKFKKTDDYIQLESYTFIEAGLGSSNVIGSKVTKMRLFFSGDTLNKVEIEILRRNFRSDTKSYHMVTDPSPGSLDTSDIIVIEQVDTNPKTEKTLGSYDNTVSNPNQLKFKREFYLPLLIDFERLFRYTQNYKRMYGTNNDYETIEILKDSQNY